MPVIKVNIGRNGALDYDASALSEALDCIAADAPVIALIHGYRFSPASRAVDPHAHILSLTPRAGCKRAVSWPRHLGFGRGAANEGLCIAIGWEARGTIWRAWDRAAVAGDAVARLIRHVRARHPAPVQILGHSLGARVALTALDTLPAHSVGRLVLLAAAAFQSQGLAALHSPAGQSAEIFNITTRENDLFDGLLEWLVRRPRAGDLALGAGLGRRVPGWLDIQIDCVETRFGLAALGFRVPAPSKRICHWSPYLRPGLFAFYRSLIRAPHHLGMDRLQSRLPDRATQRWSRLLQRPEFHLRLPTLGRLRT